MVYLFAVAVVCRGLGHEKGIPVCCGPYGYSTTPISPYRPECSGEEKQISECMQVRNGTSCSRQNYASVVCYNGTRTVDGNKIEPVHEIVLLIPFAIIGLYKQKI